MGRRGQRRGPGPLPGQRRAQRALPQRRRALHRRHQPGRRGGHLVGPVRRVRRLRPRRRPGHRSGQLGRVSGQPHFGLGGGARARLQPPVSERRPGQLHQRRLQGGPGRGGLANHGHRRLRLRQLPRHRLLPGQPEAGRSAAQQPARRDFPGRRPVGPRDSAEYGQRRGGRPQPGRLHGPVAGGRRRCGAARKPAGAEVPAGGSSRRRAERRGGFPGLRQRRRPGHPAAGSLAAGKRVRRARLEAAGKPGRTVSRRHRAGGTGGVRQAAGAGSERGRLRPGRRPGLRRQRQRGRPAADAKRGGQPQQLAPGAPGRYQQQPLGHRHQGGDPGRRALGKAGALGRPRAAEPVSRRGALRPGVADLGGRGAAALAGRRTAVGGRPRGQPRHRDHGAGPQGDQLPDPVRLER